MIATPWVVPAHAPPTPEAGGRLWRVTRYADVRTALRHPDIGVLEPWTEITRLGHRSGRDFSGLANLLQGMLFSPNHPDHVAVRQLMRQTFTQLAAAFAAAVTGAIDAHLGNARVRGHAEAVEAICRAIPTSVTVAALGLTPATVRAIRRASASVFAVYRTGIPLRVLEALEQDALAAEAAILEEFVRARRGHDTGLAMLLALGAGQFDDHTLAGYVFFLVLASVETLTGLLGSTLLLLLNHPAQWRRLAADPGLVGNCVEEVIRAAGPMRNPAPRIAVREVALGDMTIPAGAIVMPELEQAHHDPAAFVNPGTFDIARAGPPNMGFGLGAHACLGASLGRLEAGLFVRALLAAGPMRLPDPDPVWEEHVSFRRLARLEVVFG